MKDKEAGMGSKGNLSVNARSQESGKKGRNGNSQYEEDGS